MDYKTTSKYFDNITNLFRFVGFALMAAGVILSLLNLILDAFVLMSIGIILLLIGVILVVFDSGRRTKDSDIEKAVHLELDKMDQKASEKMEKERRHLHEIQKYEFHSYDFRDIGSVKVKRGSDGKLRSSKVAYTALYYMTEAHHPKVMIYEYGFSLLEFDKYDNLIEIPEENLVSAELVQNTVKTLPVGAKADTEITYALIRITYDGDKTVSFPAKNDATSDDVVATINRSIRKKQLEAQEQV